MAVAFFLGDQFVAFEGNVMRRAADGGLSLCTELERPCAIVKPPAGEVFFLSPHRLTTEFALVHVKPGFERQDGTVDEDKVLAAGGIVGVGQMDLSDIVLPDGDDEDGDEPADDDYESWKVPALDAELSRRGIEDFGPKKVDKIAALRASAAGNIRW